MGKDSRVSLVIIGVVLVQGEPTGAATCTEGKVVVETTIKALDESLFVA